MKIKELLSIPNLFSISRIFSIPFFYYFIKTNNIKALIFLTIFLGISDFLDGFLARKLNQVSDTGKFLDPFCDKVAVFSLILLIFLYRNFPLWAFFYTIIRETLVALGGLLILRKEKIPITPNFWGKANVTAEFFAFMVYLFNLNFYKKDSLIALFFYLTVSLIIYLKVFFDVYKGKKSVEKIVEEYSSYGFIKGNKLMNFFAVVTSFYFIYRIIYLLLINI